LVVKKCPKLYIYIIGDGDTSPDHCVIWCGRKVHSKLGVYKMHKNDPFKNDQFLTSKTVIPVHRGENEKFNYYSSPVNLPDMLIPPETRKKTQTNKNIEGRTRV